MQTKTDYEVFIEAVQEAERYALEREFFDTFVQAIKKENATVAESCSVALWVMGYLIMKEQSDLQLFNKALVDATHESVEDEFFSKFLDYIIGGSTVQDACELALEDVGVVEDGDDDED
jgi:hypothetical protein